jgi:hypothetical protein
MPVNNYKKEAKRFATLAKYYGGKYTYDSHEEGQPSLTGGLSIVVEMIEELYNLGTPLGSKIEITMKAIEPPRKKLTSKIWRW